MARVLRRTVITGGVTYPPGTVETAELRERITNPRAWEGEPDPEPAPRRRAPKAAQKPAKPAGAEQTGQPASETPEEPPRGGEGSGADEWRAYAQALDIEVPEGAGRDDIVALVDASRE